MINVLQSGVKRAPHGLRKGLSPPTLYISFFLPVKADPRRTNGKEATMIKSLPPKPSIRQLKIQAKNLIKAHKSGDVRVCETLKVLHRFSELTSQDIMESTVSLKEVQFALALSYGFKGWKQITEHVESLEYGKAEKDSKENIEQTHFFKEGDEVMVIDGSFKNFEGIVENVNPEKRVIKILIIIFGRQTPVELDFNQVKMIETKVDEKI